jgi:hypothetical protein
MNINTRFTFVVLCIVTFLLTFISLAPAQFKIKTDDLVKNHVAKCRIYSPVTYKNLTIIPVKSLNQKNSFKILTLDEAMKANSLIVKEVSESGNVNSLAVENNSEQYVFIMAGEILAGSKQDRVLKNDVLLPPDSGQVVVSAYCVEHGRWEYKSDKFYSEKKTANLSVRQHAKISGNQSVVWDAVAETNKRVKAESTTGSLSKSHDSPEMKQNREEYANAFAKFTEKHPLADGVIIKVNNKVLAADFFSDPVLFRKLWPKLLDSYIVEALSRTDGEVTSEISSVSDFLKYISLSRINYSGGIGNSRNIKVSSEKITGSGLCRAGKLIHLDVFPKHAKVEELKQRTERLQRNYIPDQRIRTE